MRPEGPQSTCLNLRGKQNYSHVVYDDNSDEEDDNISYRSDDDELLNDNPSSDLEEEEALGNESDYLEELPDEDDASYCTESSFKSHSTLGSTPGRRRSRALQPQSPIFEAKDIPPLDLPKSSEDLQVPTSQLLNVSAVYEVLRNFGSVLRLSPFRFEDFCAAVASQEQCTLLAEMHISLLKAILREEDTSNTTFGPTDVKDSVNSTLYFVDGMTWPEVVRAYCESDPEYRHILPLQETEDYPYEPLESKIKVLQFLVDQFLATNIAREELMSEGVVAYDDHCRVCHRLGDLLCCETCSAVYHLECVKPPLLEVPEDEWQCEVCVAHKVPGVADCIPVVQKSKPFIRQLPVGYDRHNRKYWFLNRRIVVEEDGEQEDKSTWYYSTKVQLAELFEGLDKEYWEADLNAALEEIREEVHAHMDITEDLTNKARGSNKCFLTAANEEILERLRAKRVEELEEVKRRAAEEAQKERLEKEKMEVDVENEDEEAKLRDEGQQEGKVTELTEEETKQEAIEEKKDGGENPASDSVPGSGDGIPSLSQLPQASKENSNSSMGAVTRCPEPPDLADKSSQSSLASLDDIGDGKDANGELSPGGRGSAATRMVTRLRNPESKLSQMKSQQVAAAVHEANKVFKEGKEVLVVNAQGDVTRVSTRGKEVVMKGTLSPFFKLGQEGKYRVYHNQYSSNTVALNKHQHREDHDKRRHLSHKFCMTPAGEFKWNGSIHGSKVLTISTLRITIIQLENNVPAPFMHPNWASHRTNWIKAVQMCSKAREFALALAILECAIKPVAMLPATWVKYTFPIKHQVWKQKGEEYRVTGYGGWSWISRTYVQRFDPKLPGNTNPNYRKELEDAKLGKKCTLLDLSRRPSVAAPEAQGAAVSSSSSIQEEKTAVKEEPTDISTRPFNYDVVDVSKGFITRIPYKKVKTSKLDGLLERRVKQRVIEERQRQQASAANPQTLTPVAFTATPPPSTPVRPRSPLKPHALAQTQLALGRAVKEEEKPTTQIPVPGTVEGREDVKEGLHEPSKTTNQTVSLPTPSPVPDSTPKDSCSTGINPNPETLGSAHSSTEENGMGPKEILGNIERIGQGKTESDSIPKPVSPLPQDGTQPKPLVNGDLAPLNDCTEVGDKGPSLVSKIESKTMTSDQDYKPPLKIARLENNVGALGTSTSPFQSMEDKPSPALKIIRMAPSPIPSAEESSLSDGFAEENSRTTEPLKTIITQVTTTSTTTTTVVSTEMRIAKMPSNAPAVVKKPVASTTENSAVSTLTTMTKTTVTKVCSPGLDSQSEDSQSEIVTKEQKTALSVSKSTTDSRGKTSVSSVAVSLEDSLSTKGRVRLLKFSRTKKTRSDTALPSYRKFVTKSSRKSIFVLPHDNLKVLARRGGFREVSIFSYNAKPALDIWPYPSPRPTFGITWRYRLQTVKSLAGVSLMLRLLWASLRWDDMAVKPSAAIGTTRTETSDTEITTTEIIKRRDVGPYGIRSEYCIRKIICPLGVPDTPKETHTPQRKGLRSSALRPKKAEPAKQTGPVVMETWVAEEELDLWEIRAFSERVEREKAQAVEQAKKRLEQKPGITVTPTGTPATPVSTPKVIIGSLSGQGTATTKVVLSTKMGTPVTFQQNKNFQQSFATWVKQGQSTQGETTLATSSGHTFQITGTSMGGKVVTTKLPLPSNSKIVTVNVPTSQGGVVQQKVLGIIPSGTAGGAQTFTTFQPRTTTLNIRPNTPGSQQQVLAAGAQIRPGMTVIRTPIQQTGQMGKTILRTPLVVQQGQSGQQVVTQIIRGQAVSTAISGASPVATVTGQGAGSPTTAAGTPRAQGQKQQAGSAVDRQAGVGGTQQALTVMVQGQGQTTGQLQIIPHGVTVIPGPGQQLMQAALPNGQVQRFLFTPIASAATPTSSTVPGQLNSTSTKTPAQPAQQAAAPVQAGATPLATTSTPSSATPQGQLPPQTQAHMPIQSPTSLQVLAQLQAQQGGGSLPQHIKLQLPIQIQQAGTTSAQGGQVVMKQNAVIEHLKQKKTMTPVEREENQRMIVCNQLSSLLYRHKESLKMEILKKRALLDKELQLETQEELKRDLLRIRREKERAQAAAQQPPRQPLHATSINTRTASHLNTTSPPAPPPHTKENGRTRGRM
ncbi:Nucleosome-remodeling factor subunit BPTF [Dissostichus eleginoides]|uniref:Nucleosome-remodeling factor subunit BPTF n=1 Tax=Dissostichus eleginoides TaxID=100907 RepID=A0AAD9BPZ9_DISEL|nr:Nucleosome-remodeling factor subunit BPTF [Dissostichus eleginoides]